MKTNAILLAGGQGRRMGSDIPKQFISLLNRPIISYSLQSLASCPLISEIVVVIDAGRQALIKELIHKLNIQTPIVFTLPGKERQDSVLNGLLSSSEDIEFSAVHDGARPLVEPASIKEVIEAAYSFGAAGLGTPVSLTIKQAKDTLEIEQTLDRSNLYEMQTPQVAKRQDLIKGYQQASIKGLTLTDELSAIEFLKLPSKIVIGPKNNLKVTHPLDLKLAKLLIEESKANQ